MAENDAPASGGTRVRRFRVRTGFVPAFTRLDLCVLQVGFLTDCDSFVEIAVRALRGDDRLGAQRIHWYVNPTRRVTIPITGEEAEDRMAAASVKVTFTRSSLMLACGRVTLVEFDAPLEHEQYMEVDAPQGKTIEPPDWAREDVTHDPSTEPYQIAVNHFRERLSAAHEDGIEDLLRKDP